MQMDMKEKTLWNTKYREEALFAVDNPIEATTNHCALGCNSRPRGPENEKQPVLRGGDPNG